MNNHRILATLLCAAALASCDKNAVQPVVFEPLTGARIKFSGGKRTVVDGPFTETKELIAGYWIIQVKSREEAIEWAKRVPNLRGEGQEGEIELRQFFELDDFGPSEAVDRAREMGKELSKKK